MSMWRPLRTMWGHIVRRSDLVSRCVSCVSCSGIESKRPMVRCLAKKCVCDNSPCIAILKFEDLGCLSG